jgi:septal ring factor EnvC (AmiA/AmiB activator)
MIQFPVLEHVSVDNFALYAGTRDLPGLHHNFQPGVNVIVGINGLGKTTLLNILLRALTGPFDSPGGDELGEKKRRLVPADRSWFRRRVPNDAVDAQVKAIFRLGQQQFEVVRSLANLDLVALWVDQRSVERDKPIDLEAAYQSEITSASGLTSFDDFVFLLRYLVFFLEDRRTLVWDAAAQGEILGMLFGEQDGNRQRYVEVFNELLSRDSEYRNMLAVVNKREKLLRKQASSIDGGQLDMLLKQLDERREQVSALSQRKTECAQVRDSLRDQIENHRRDIHEIRAAVATDINRFYESFFPQINEAARYLLSYFDAQAGCLVCGKDSPEAIARVNAKLVMNVCPVCDSPIEHADNPAHDPYANDAIETRRAEIAQMEAYVEEMIEPLQTADREYAQVAAELVAATAEIPSLEKQLDALGQTLPGATQRREKLEHQFLTFKAALNQLEAERAELAAEFAELANGIDRDVRSVSQRIESSFARFISGFLAENCQISYTARQSRIGQRTTTESFPFPHFIPALTSGVHRTSATPREHGQSVSESQKEFIDLAFRMALLEVAAPDAPSMLVLETPEASLDSRAARR